MVTKARALLGYEHTKIGVYLDHSHIAKIDFGTTGPYLLIKQAIDRAILDENEQQGYLGPGDAPLRRSASAAPLLGDHMTKIGLTPKLAGLSGRHESLNNTEADKDSETALLPVSSPCRPSPIGEDLPINRAIHEGDIAKVKTLLKEAHIDQPDSQAYTPLMIAAATDQEQVVDDLIRRRASLKASGPKNDTAFHLACRHAGVAVVSIFLKHAELLDIRGAEGRTPLMSSIQNSREDIAKLVLGSVDNVEASDEHGRTALHYAALEGKTEIVRLLIVNHEARQNATTREYGWTPLHYAAQRKHHEVIELLGKNGTDCNTLTSQQDGARSAIHLLLLEPELLRYKVGCMSMLLRYGANIDQPDGAGRNPLHWAAKHDESGTVEWLISKKANLEARTMDEYRETALHIAVERGHLKASRVLLDAGANKDAATEFAPGATALHIATEGNDIDLVKELLARKAKVDPMCICEAFTAPQTPLLFATRDKNIEIIRLLVDSGAKVEGVDDMYESSPLSIAVRKGNLATVRALLNYGANPGTLHSALSEAIELGYSSIVKELLAKGAKAQSEHLKHKGFPCLFIAASFGQVDITELLLDHGADPEQKVGLIDDPPGEKKWRAGDYFVHFVMKEKRRRIRAILAQARGGCESKYVEA